jgi:hypothetical protein
VAQNYFFSGPLLLFSLFAFPVAVSVTVELRFLTTNNEFQMYSAAVCVALFLILALFWLALWIVVYTHYRHKHHPLVSKRFGFVLKSIKDPENEKDHTLISQAYIPFSVTKRLGAAFVIGLLCRYTLGPILILALL